LQWGDGGVAIGRRHVSHESDGIICRSEARRPTRVAVRVEQCEASSRTVGLGSCRGWYNLAGSPSGSRPVTLRLQRWLVTVEHS
jgi:hypothetical protein